MKIFKTVTLIFDIDERSGTFGVTIKNEENNSQHTRSGFSTFAEVVEIIPSILTGKEHLGQLRKPTSFNWKGREEG